MSKLVGYVLFVTLYCFVQGKEKPGSCTCAIMAEGSMEPLLQHTMDIDIPCDAEGAIKCESLCLILADGAKEGGPALVCGKLKNHVDNLMVEMYTKACGTNVWKFSGLKSTEPLCCHGGKTAVCNKMETVTETIPNESTTLSPTM